MRRMLIVLAAVWSMAGTAAAQMEFPNSVAKRVGVYGNLGFSQFAMADENRYIDSLNAYYGPMGGVAVNKLTGGLLFNLGLEYGVSDNFLVGLEYEALLAASQTDILPGLRATFNFPAGAFGGFVKAALPVGDFFLFNVGAGIYYLSLENGQETYSQAGYPDVIDTYRGSAAEFKVSAGADVFFTPNFVLGVDVGYRAAKIGELRNPDLPGEPKWLNPDGSNFTLDYSGAFAQAGIRWFFDNLGM